MSSTTGDQVDNDFYRIAKLVKQKGEKFPDLRLFILTQDRWFRAYKGKIEEHQSIVELDFI